MARSAKQRIDSKIANAQLDPDTRSTTPEPTTPSVSNIYLLLDYSLMPFSAHRALNPSMLCTITARRKASALANGGLGAAGVAQLHAESLTVHCLSPHLLKCFVNKLNHLAVARNRAEDIREKGNWTRKRNNALRARIAEPGNSNSEPAEDSASQQLTSQQPSRGQRLSRKRQPLPEKQRRGRRNARNLSRSPTPGSTDHELEPEDTTRPSKYAYICIICRADISNRWLAVHLHLRNAVKRGSLCPRPPGSRR